MNHELNQILAKLRVEVGSDTRVSFIVTRLILKTGVNLYAEPHTISERDLRQVTDALLEMGLFKDTPGGNAK